MIHYLKERIRSLIQLDETPQRLALAFAVGIFIAFSPWFGLHIASCFLIAWVFRLSKLVVVTASLINNPWTVVPMYGFCIWFGIRMTGADIQTPDIQWQELTLSNSYDILKPFLWSYVVGTTVIGIAAAVISYFIFLRVVIRYRKRGAVGCAVERG